MITTSAKNSTNWLSRPPLRADSAVTMATSVATCTQVWNSTPRRTLTPSQNRAESPPIESSDHHSVHQAASVASGRSSTPIGIARVAIRSRARIRGSRPDQRSPADESSALETARDRSRGWFGIRSVRPPRR